MPKRVVQVEKKAPVRSKFPAPGSARKPTPKKNKGVNRGGKRVY